MRCEGRSLCCAAMAATLVALFSVQAVAQSDPFKRIEKVSLSARDGHEALTGYLLRPKGPGRHPAVVALHGCSGLFAKYGGLTSRHLDWGLRLSNEGYVVLFPDSFGSRGWGSLCRVKKRPVKQRHRVGDAIFAARWLRDQPFVDGRRVALLGWSNGGITVLRTVVRKEARVFRTAIAFYPGCKVVLKKTKLRPRVPLSILMGAADDWTAPAPCAALAKRWDVPITLYQGAYHGFDAPGNRLRVRKGMAFTATGTGMVHVGTNKEARRRAIVDVRRILSGM